MTKNFSKCVLLVEKNVKAASNRVQNVPWKKVGLGYNNYIALRPGIFLSTFLLPYTGKNTPKNKINFSQILCRDVLYFYSFIAKKQKDK